MRSFVAVPCPPERLPALTPVLASLAGPDWRPVPAGQFHLTVRFLGEQPEPLLQRLASRLAPALAAVPAFALDFAGLGVFPSARRPEVLWAGCAGSGAAAFARLAATVEEVLAGLGLPPEGRPLRPHLTLARRRSGADPGRAAAAAAAACAGAAGRAWGRVEVGAAVLFRSELGPGGARHSPLARLPLAPAAPD